MQERKKIAIIGLGLIGGSLAIQLHEKKLSSSLLGVETNSEHAAQALEMELVDKVVDLETAISSSDVIIIAIPVNWINELLPRILDMIDQQIVIDLGSTKSEMIEAVKNHPKRGRYVATHPMWGREYSGPTAAVRDAFENRAVVICDAADSDKDALHWVRHMYQKIGMHLIDMEGKAHDLHAAYISHVSHITSFALANTVLEKEKEEQAIFEMASGGFESTVRLAKSHSGMWVPIFLQNRHHVLDVLREHIVQLQKFETTLENNDEQGLKKLIEDANRIRRIIK